MPCALSSALVMWGCRGLGLNGAMVPLVLCADSMCARRSSPCTVPGGEGLIDGGYSFKVLLCIVLRANRRKLPARAYHASLLLRLQVLRRSLQARGLGTQRTCERSE